jgi:hypothetical protein
MLYQRATGRGFKIRVLFFFGCMWCMIGSYNIDPVIQQSFQQFIFIVFGFDCRIPFNEGTQFFIRGIIKP